MAKVTYLLGAGASANSLPIVADLTKAIADMIGRINSIIEHIEKDSSRDGEKFENYKCVGRDLMELREGCLNHASIDTYVKMLFLTDNHGKYRKTKCAIILFFELYRYYERKFDKRYDGFIASILNRDKPRFPTDVNLISWNYDYEFERAFLKYCGATYLEAVYEQVNIIHKNAKCYNRIGNDFGILKINGTVGFLNEGKNISLGLGACDLYMDGSPDDYDRLYPIVYKYISYTYKTLSEHSPAISFSWEDDYGEAKLIDEISQALENTTTLVVIGYSFPYFNRIIDRVIMSALQGDKIKNVYVQDPHATRLIENLKGLRGEWLGVKIQPVENTDQFYMPHEL